MKHLHDVGYKKLFQNKVIFRELLETFVHEEWVQAIDFDTCETLDKSFISDHYKETESDLIYKVRLRGQEAYVVILLEFQSTVDRYMALRVLNYIIAFYLDYAHSQTHPGKLPPVFPIVLYRGKRRWTAPVRISDLIEQPELLGRFAVQFEYFKINERDFTRDELLQIGNIFSTLFLTETQYDVNALVDECNSLFDIEDREAFETFINWLLNWARHGQIPMADYTEIVRNLKSKEEVRELLVHTFKDHDKAIRKKARREGRLKGKIEGKIEGKFEVARAMLSKGFAVALIVEMTGLPEEEVLRLQQEAGTSLLAPAPPHQTQGGDAAASGAQSQP